MCIPRGEIPACAYPEAKYRWMISCIFEALVLVLVSIEEEQQVSNEGFEELNELDRHLQKHRELFLSRQVETVPATHIRGKCSVTLLNETESIPSYLRREVVLRRLCTTSMISR